jgi:hypothetical protein
MICPTKLIVFFALLHACSGAATKNLKLGADIASATVANNDDCHSCQTCLPNAVIAKKYTTIEANAFAQCKTVTSVIMHDSITSIGVRAFDRSWINSVVIPDSVTTIEEAAFLDSRITTAHIGLDEVPSFIV